MEKYYNINDQKLIRVNGVKRRDVIIIRSLIILGVVIMCSFIFWFFDPDHIGNSLLFWLLTSALVFKLFKMLHEWYHYWDVSIPVPPEVKTNWKVDILTTACPGEPKSMIIQTLVAMQKITYPHTSYLCDEGNDPELKQICQELNIIHVTRNERTDAKAGNINNALKQAKGDICIVLDPDHIPIPEMIDRVLPYFEDQSVGFVQSVQGYYNQKESFVAQGAAEQTYHFYGPMMMCMNSYGTAQAIGANCAFRRAALDSIGGHAPGLSEDMHTAMQIHAAGWKSVYIPEILTKGLVPSTLPSYYSQQLKWARGTFDLLFYTYPKLFKKFTTRQKIHYLTLPFYFFFGVINFIDIAIPAMALLLAEVPWTVDLNDFALIFIPLCILSLSIRMFAQRWLLESQEKGLHIVGGILRTSTWWIYLLGFIYTIFKVKVPYIPTPKNDTVKNNWMLSLPNLFAFIICIATISYGLYFDWTPYSISMAGFALLNAGFLGVVVFFGQEQFLQKIKLKIRNIYVLYPVFKIFQNIKERSNANIISVMRYSSFGVLGILFFFLVSYSRLEPLTLEKTAGGFYTGAYFPEFEKNWSLQPALKFEKSLSTKLDIISFYQAWGRDRSQQFPEEFLKKIIEKGAIPMITWEPWSNTFPEFSSDSLLANNKGICRAIISGKFDNYLNEYSSKVRDFGEPIFIRFGHEPDNPAYPWSKSGDNTPEEYVMAWKYVFTLFKKNGVSNVTWVWNPWQPDKMLEYYPGKKYVNWVAITSLNYGEAGPEWMSFEKLYRAFRKTLLTFEKPIMLAEFGSTSLGGNQSEWIRSALELIKENYKEIQSVVFFNSKEDKNWPAYTSMKGHSGFINWTIEDSASTYPALRKMFSELPFSDDPANKKNKHYTYKLDPHIQRSYIKGQRGAYELIVDNKPFYIKGVAYNTAHDWRDGNLPLTRKQVTKDFNLIKKMGANTIRRYSPGIYDRNILKVAAETKLKVLYGFWFDPEVDYYTDTVQINEYISDVEEMVVKYRNEPCILGWTIGNEGWGLLKDHFSQPYLTKVRAEYVKLIEYLAQRIHLLDPTRPVLTASEQEGFQLAAELNAYRKGAPSIDIIAINSYYPDQLNILQYLTSAFNPNIPYVISEFGPLGYWNPELNRYDEDTLLLEDNDDEKGKLYCKEWNSYVQKYKGYNVGGIVFSWRDRMEGTNTWYGITDYKARIKPSYYAIKNLWTNEKANMRREFITIEKPKEQVLPGKEYVYSAGIKSLRGDLSNYKKEWYLYRDEQWNSKMEKLHLKKINNLEVSDDGVFAKVKIPDEDGTYRLYLYLSDNNGNVYTASKGIKVEKLKASKN